MSPESFNFTVTLPGDERLVGVVRDICAHAVGYARLPEAVGVSFCAQVADAARQAVSARPDAPCALVFDCRGGELQVTVAGHTVTLPPAA